MSAPDRRALLLEKLRSLTAQPEFPLSYSQQRVWFLDQLEPDRGVYNLPLSYRIRGALDPHALEAALNDLIARHEVLHSAFPARNGKPRQVVNPHTPVQLPIIDLGAVPDGEARTQQITADEARQPFDIAKGPVIRAKLIRLAPDDHLFLLTIHHIACDAWSLALIGSELSALYKAHQAGGKSTLAPLALQYADFSEWQAQHLGGPKRAELVGYWRERLAGSPACISLPTDRPRPPVQSYDGAYIAFELPQPLIARVDELARKEGATPYVVFMSALAATLTRYTGGEDVLIGTPVANRHDARLESVIGFFSNTLVLRPPMARCSSFTDVVSAVASELRDGIAHQDLPFELLVEELAPQRDTAHSPIFQVMFMYWEGDYDQSWDLPGCTVKAAIGDSGTAKFDLTLHITRTDKATRVRLEYATALFDQATAERISAHFVNLLGNATARAADDLAALEVLSDDERRLVTQDWAYGPQLPGEFRAVHQLIAQQAARTPDAPAVIDGEATLGYRDLDAAAGAFAARLRALGVGPGSIVGVYLDRSVHTSVALLGILKAGGAYLPLDPAYPADRLAFMVADSGATIVVSTRALLAQASELGAEAVAVDAVRAAPAAPYAASPAADDLAYVIYTSGSTGKPKGVKLTHKNLATFLAAMDSTFGENPGTWLAVTSISFDISVLELLWTLTRGFRVIIRRDEQIGGRTAAPARAKQPAAKPATAKPVEFSLFFFGNAPAGADATASRYRMVFESARWADEQGFTAIWIPERHFHAFGGLYPNPSVLAAAIAGQTKRIAIRAGSVVLPLHDPLRVAEEWALVDNLSSGRVGMSIASGWQPDDFVLAPDRYANRKQLMMTAIDQVRRLWRGEKIKRTNGINKEIEVGVYPRPIQKELPVWITSAQTPDTFRMAGEAGASILTHLVGHTAEQLAEKIGIYRDAWRKAGFSGNGHVTLMVHTFVGGDNDAVKATVREPLKDYIRTSFDLMAGVGAARNVDLRQLPANEVEELLDRSFERFFDSQGLLGTTGRVADTVERLSALGIDEVGCLIDFGVADDAALAALTHLGAARDEYLRRRSAAQAPEPVDPNESIAAQLQRYGVTHLQCTPSLAGVLVEDKKARPGLRGLSRMLVGGEALPPELANSLTDAVGGSVHNMYGPTEATVWATTSQVVHGQSPVIGRPLPGYRAYVVDSKLRPVPIGVPGELLLGGAAVSAGYHGRPELTAEKFVVDSFATNDSSSRLYRTGDVVRWRATGELEFMGRIDHQVKLRGRRIELGEIEAALAAHPAVRGAVCDIRGEGDTKRIVGYLVPEGPALPPVGELRQFIAGSLPDYMLPSTYVRVDAFPLTPNGKINRRALPEPGNAALGGNGERKPPVGELEQSIAAIWQELLRTDQVGRDDNFFSIGGNSILVVAVRSRLLERTGTEISLVDLFRYPTIASLAAALAARSAPQHGASATPASGAAAKAAEAGERRRAAARRASGGATGQKP